MARARIAKTGGDIDDNVEDLCLDTDTGYMVILEERTDTANGSGVVTITHNLGYIPAFYTFEEYSSGKWRVPFSNNSYATTTQIVINATASVEVRTIIFGNSQSDATGTGNTNVSGKFRVSKSGFDAETETDLRNMKFASAGGVFKLSESKAIDVSVTGANGTFTTTYAHGLSYVPVCYVLLYSTTGISIPFYDFGGAGIAAQFDYEIDDTNITVSVFNQGGAVSSPSTVTFKAHILLDKIA